MNGFDANSEEILIFAPEGLSALFGRAEYGILTTFDKPTAKGTRL